MRRLNPRPPSTYDLCGGVRGWSRVVFARLWIVLLAFMGIAGILDGDEGSALTAPPAIALLLAGAERWKDGDDNDDSEPPAPEDGVERAADTGTRRA